MTDIENLKSWFNEEQDNDLLDQPLFLQTKQKLSRQEKRRVERLKKKELKRRTPKRKR